MNVNDGKKKGHRLNVKDRNEDRGALREEEGGIIVGYATDLSDLYGKVDEYERMSEMEAKEKYPHGFIYTDENYD